MQGTPQQSMLPTLRCRLIPPSFPFGPIRHRNRQQILVRPALLCSALAARASLLFVGHFTWPVFPFPPTWPTAAAGQQNMWPIIAKTDVFTCISVWVCIWNRFSGPAPPLDLVPVSVCSSNQLANLWLKMAAGYFFGEGRERVPTILLLCCLIICHYSVAIRLIAVGFEPTSSLKYYAYARLAL